MIFRYNILNFMVLSEYYLKVIHIQIIKYSEFNKMIPDY